MRTACGFDATVEVFLLAVGAKDDDDATSPTEKESRGANNDGATSPTEKEKQFVVRHTFL